MKRALDVLGSGLALLLLLPIMCVIAVLVKATSPGPIIYGQRRVGLRGHVFKVRKFRSMREDAEAQTGAVWAGENDTRVTPIGRILRRTHLDELPQFWNILIGDMSLVGPRPERPEFVKELTQRDPVLRPAAHRAPRPDGMGPGLLRLRRQRRRCDAEAAVRPVLHQAHVARPRRRTPCFARSSGSFKDEGYDGARRGAEPVAC